MAPSRIHGEGVFAAAGFRKGEHILAIDDTQVVPEGADIEKVEREHGQRCDDIAGGRVVVLRAPHFTNHSCDPTSYTRTIEGVRYRLALRDISAGEEITSDYCINGRGDTVWECSCGSARCRRTIHSDFFHLPLELQLEYLPLLDDWFVEENRERVQTLRRRAV